MEIVGILSTIPASRRLSKNTSFLKNIEIHHETFASLGCLTFDPVRQYFRQHIFVVCFVYFMLDTTYHQFNVLLCLMTGS